MNKLPLIHIRNLSVGYDDRALLQGIEASLLPGELVVLIGANGSGKTTLLKTIAGILSPVSGVVSYEGESVDKIPLDILARKRTAVWNDEMPFGPFSVWEWVKMGRLPYSDWQGKLAEDDARYIEEALCRVGMSEFSSRRINALSQGEIQKVRIAKALAQDTPVILMDEPLAHLDLPARFEMLRLFKELTENEGRTLVFSTHDLVKALQSADKVWMIDVDRQFISRTPEDLMDTGDINRLFSGNIKYDREKREFVYNRKD